MRPFLALERNLCLVEVIYGDADALRRQEAESGLIDHLGSCGISLKSVDLNASGCYIIVHGSDLERLKAAVRLYNVAVRVRDECGRLSLRRRGQWATFPSLTSILSAFHRRSIRVMYLFAGPAQIDVLVADQQIPSAMRILHRL
jgi:hypothetical protein